MKSLKISNLINKAIDNFINLLNGEEFEDDRK
jgi:hypothetical protein